MDSMKTIYTEPQRKDALSATMSDYYSKIKEPGSRGACFMAVCRGKVAEGLDFADENGRFVGNKNIKHLLTLRHYVTYVTFLCLELASLDFRKNISHHFSSRHLNLSSMLTR